MTDQLQEPIQEVYDSLPSPVATQQAVVQQTDFGDIQATFVYSRGVRCVLAAVTVLVAHVLMVLLNLQGHASADAMGSMLTTFGLNVAPVLALTYWLKSRAALIWATAALSLNFAILVVLALPGNLESALETIPIFVLPAMVGVIVPSLFVKKPSQPKG